MKNAKLFALIGIAEALDDFLDRFCARYGMVKANSSRSYNRLTKHPLFDYDDKAVRSILTPLVETDLRLYHEIIQWHDNRGG